MIKDKSKKTLVSWVEDQYSQKRTEMQPYYEKWITMLSFIVGKQWVFWSKAQQRAESINKYIEPSKRGKPRLVRNRVLSVYRILLAKLLRIEPEWLIDSDDIMFNRKAQNFLKLIYEKLEARKKIREIANWIVSCGTCWVHPYLNKFVGDEYEIDGQKVREGDISLDIISPFNLVSDPLGRWVILTRIEDVDTARQKYDSPDIKSETIKATNDIEAQLLQRYDVDRPIENVCLVKELWRKPCQEYPKGQVAIIIQKKVVYDGELPDYALDDKSGGLPFIQFHGIKVPGLPYSMSLVENIIPIQKEYNKARSQMLAHKELLMYGKLLLPDGCGITDDQWTDEPGEKVRYNPQAGEIKYMTPPELPSYAYRDLNVMLQEMYDVSGVHEVSMGDRPAGISSGVALSYLGEQDETQLAIVKQDFETSLEQLGRQLLIIASHGFITTRQFFSSSQEAFSFSGKDFDIKNDFRVRVNVGKDLSHSQTARQQLIMGLWDKRIITDPTIILKMLGFPETESAYKESVLDEDQARRENKQLVEGVQIPPLEWHNHAVHYKIHNELRKTKEFEKLSPKIQGIVDAHAQAHYQFLQEIIQRLQGQAMPEVGGGTPMEVNE